MTNEFIHPNYHVILIHYPLGLLSVGILIELFSFLWRRHSFRAAGRWMILLGALLAIPTLTSGIYAYRNVLSHLEDETYSELLASSPLNQTQIDMIWMHIRFNVSAVLVFAVVIVGWLGCSDRWRRNLHIPFLLLLLAGLGLTVVGAWHGGEMVYAHGVGVEEQRADNNQHPNQPGDHPEGSTALDIERYVQPMQMHVISAGAVIAVALAALGLSIRAISIHPAAAGDEVDLDTDPGTPEETGIDSPVPLQATSSQPNPLVADIAAQEQTRGDEYDVATGNPRSAYVSPGGGAYGSTLADKTGWSDHRTTVPTRTVVEVERVPTSRFWLLTALLGLGTAAGGVWVTGIRSYPEFMDFVKHAQRSYAHAILGVSIIVLTLILSGVTRWAPRRKLTLTIFAVLLFLVLGAQLWMGILLLFDTRVGPLTRFNPAGATPASRADGRGAGGASDTSAGTTPAPGASLSQSLGQAADSAGRAASTAAQRVEETAKSAGEAAKSAAQSAGDSLKSAATTPSTPTPATVATTYPALPATVPATVSTTQP